MKNELERGEKTNEAEEKAYVYYQSCLDVNDTMEKLGVGSIY